MNYEKETIIKGKKLNNPLPTKSFVRTTLMGERWVIYMDAQQKWYVTDTETDSNDGGTFDYESDAQHFADCKNGNHKLIDTVGRKYYSEECMYCSYEK